MPWHFLPQRNHQQETRRVDLSCCLPDGAPIAASPDPGSQPAPGSATASTRRPGRPTTTPAARADVPKAALPAAVGPQATSCNILPAAAGTGAGPRSAEPPPFTSVTPSSSAGA
jgi:hypothetical protein